MIYFWKSFYSSKVLKDYYSLLWDSKSFASNRTLHPNLPCMYPQGFVYERLICVQDKVDFVLLQTRVSAFIVDRRRKWNSQGIRATHFGFGVHPMSTNWQIVTGSWKGKQYWVSINSCFPSDLRYDLDSDFPTAHFPTIPLGGKGWATDMERISNWKTTLLSRPTSSSCILSAAFIFIDEGNWNCTPADIVASL